MTDEQPSNSRFDIGDDDTDVDGINEPTPQPDDASARAIDELFAGAFADSADTDDAARRVRHLVGLLDGDQTTESDSDGVPGDSTLTDLTWLRVVRDRERAGPQLNQASADALDAYVQAGYFTRFVGRKHRERAERLDALGVLLTLTGEADAGAVTERLLERMASAPRRNRWRLGPGGRVSRPATAWRVADIVAVAAVLLVAASVSFPMLSNLRHQARTVGCASNLASVAGAMGLYADDNDDSLPLATNGFDGTWMQVGSTPNRSNSANLFQLTRSDYTPISLLACPGNPHAVRSADQAAAFDWRSLEDVSYSYQVMDGPRPLWAQHPQQVVLADRSPVILHAARGEPIIPEENSPNHLGVGQEVVHLDGSTRWSNSPVIRDDNIWLPRGIERIIREARTRIGIIRGTERPEAVEDAFLGP